MKLRFVIAVVLTSVVFLGAAGIGVAQPPYVVSVRTSTGTDTLVQGVLSWIWFVVDSAGSEPIEQITWPLSFTYTGNSIIGPVYDTGSYPSMGVVPWPGGLDSVYYWQAVSVPTADTVLVELYGETAHGWTGTGDQWRMTFVPADTGHITIDTTTVMSRQLTAVDSSGAYYPISWQPHTLTVVPYCPSGDLNADGIVDGRDLFILVRYILYSGPAPDVCLAHADVNCDGAITSGDIINEIHYTFHGDRSIGYTCSPEMQALWGCQ